MASNDYAFIDHWRVKSTVEEIDQIISDPAEFSRWWPSVYRKMVVTKRNEAGVSLESEALVKGWLPYTLHLFFHTVEINSPYGFKLEVTGEFDGSGVWTFTQDGEWVNITYEWKIRANKPILKYASFMLKPIFASNHHWCMRKGEESLALELQRRHARTEAERAAVPLPPQPIKLFYFGI